MLVKFDERYAARKWTNDTKEALKGASKVLVLCGDTGIVVDAERVVEDLPVFDYWAIIRAEVSKEELLQPAYVIINGSSWWVVSVDPVHHAVSMLEPSHGDPLVRMTITERIRDVIR